MDDSGAELPAVQRGGDRLQEGVSAFHRQRPGGGHHGVELGIG
jgi:hypothetical protein